MKRTKGFTLIEVLMAMVLAVSVLGPASLWFYRKSIHAEAFKRLNALSALEEEMALAMTGPFPDRDWRRTLPDGSVVLMQVEAFAGEIRLHGTVSLPDGRVRAALSASRYMADTLAREGGLP